MRRTLYFYLRDIRKTVRVQFRNGQITVRALHSLPSTSNPVHCRLETIADKDSQSRAKARCIYWSRMAAGDDIRGREMFKAFADFALSAFSSSFS